MPLPPEVTVGGVMDSPGFSKPEHQYGAAPRELDVTEAQELALWVRDGFTQRNEESTT